ncbi:hypothetical protein SAY86_003331 [Trapa natans]|uniref:Uncharacterized protein n=1 Tax=Trapa natans TaxID=22666 RepID=A0AAN7MDI3_TRANT|nr:hypothetical protein SAY86_003331 [Trapa natans]
MKQLHLYWRFHQVMWRVVKRVIGTGFRCEKCEVMLVGTLVTHRRFLGRNRGTYGPAIQAGKNSFPFPGHSTPIAQLYCCGTLPSLELGFLLSLQVVQS